MNFLTSFLFWLLINCWGAIIPVIYFPVFITRSSWLADHGAKTWSAVVLWLLKKLCKIDYEIIGMEKLPSESCIVACKHQSVWETIVMHLIFKRPAYVFKKELLQIPFYGWFVRIMSAIKIDRKGGSAALRDLIKQTKKYLACNQTVIIFPQGTRVNIGNSTGQYPYQIGIAALYLSCNVKVVPAALNSGVFWPKNTLLKKPGKITLEFLEPINPGLSKQEFIAHLSEAIEKRSTELVDAV
jgi:1-acyl-sn-glycerol-3-phosphate acyltransferase